MVGGEEVMSSSTTGGDGDNCPLECEASSNVLPTHLDMWPCRDKLRLWRLAELHQVRHVVEVDERELIISEVLVCASC
jgi:hypothetical protein